MELDPKLALLATAAMAPTKILVDYLSSSVYIPGQIKLGIGFALSLFLIILYQSYTGEVDQAESFKRLVSGDMLAAFTTLTGAVMLTQAQNLSDKKKVERKSKVEDTA